MRRYQRAVLFAAVVGSVITLSGLLAAQKVKIEYDKKNDFNRFKTYSWAKRDDEYLRPFIAAVVIGATDQSLQKKGLRKVDEGGDLVVSGYGALDTDMSVIGRPDIYVFPPVYAGAWWGAPMYLPGTSTATVLKKGTLMMDLADPHTKTLQWRGIATANFDSTKKEQAFQTLEKAIAKMFKEYPGRPSAP
jgi:hypothetical protein